MEWHGGTCKIHSGATYKKVDEGGGNLKEPVRGDRGKMGDRGRGLKETNRVRKV